MPSFEFSRFSILKISIFWKLGVNFKFRKNREKINVQLLFSRYQVAHSELLAKQRHKLNYIQILIPFYVVKNSLRNFYIFFKIFKKILQRIKWMENVDANFNSGNLF